MIHKFLFYFFVMSSSSISQITISTVVFCLSQLIYRSYKKEDVAKERHIIVENIIAIDSLLAEVFYSWNLS